LLAILCSQDLCNKSWDPKPQSGFATPKCGGAKLRHMSDQRSATLALQVLRSFIKNIIYKNKNYKSDSRSSISFLNASNAFETITSTGNCPYDSTKNLNLPSLISYDDKPPCHFMCLLPKPN